MYIYVYMYIYIYIYVYQQYITTTLSKRKNILSYGKSILICKIHIVGIWGCVRVSKYFF